MRVYILCAIILVIAFLQGCGYDDEVLAAQHYQDMVCAKAWPPTDFYTLEDCPELGPAMPERY